MRATSTDSANGSSVRTLTHEDFNPSDQRRLTFNAKSSLSRGGPNSMILSDDNSHRRPSQVSKQKNAAVQNRVSVISKNNIRFNINTLAHKNKNEVMMAPKKGDKATANTNGSDQADFSKTYSSRNNAEPKKEDVMSMSTFQTRFSRDSSKNNILDKFSEFFVSATSVN